MSERWWGCLFVAFGMLVAVGIESHDAWTLSLAGVAALIGIGFLMVYLDRLRL